MGKDKEKCAGEKTLNKRFYYFYAARPGEIMGRENESEEKNGRAKKHNLVHVLCYSVLVILVLLLVFIAGQFSIPKDNGKIEERLLLNFFREKQEFNSREIWDLNEWLPRKNFYLESYYNLLLEYNDNELTALVRSEESCLSKLFTESLDENCEANCLEDSTRAFCNTVGEKINNRIIIVLEGKK